MVLQNIIEFLEEIAPLSLQEPYDNAGLIVGNPSIEVQGVLVCLDSTPEVIQEAIDKKCNVVIAHHPIVFQGLKKIQGISYIERAVILAIKHDIAIYAIHTNLDNVFHQGVNAKICERLELQETQILAPKSLENPHIGSGMMGILKESMAEPTFMNFLKSRMQVHCIRHTSFLNKPISKVAVCGGSGSFLLDRAIHQGAQVFISADFKYHQFFDADGKIVIADIGHYESEQFTIPLIHELITNNFTNFAAYCTDRVTNPINYY